MKKNQIKNYLKLGILLFGMSLIMVSCQKDDDLNLQGNRSQSLGVKSQILNSKDIENNSGVLEALSLLENSQEAKDSIINGYNFGFTINKDYVIYLKGENIESYTFHISRKISNGYLLENLVLLKSNNSYVPILYQYDITTIEYDIIEKGKEIDLDGKIKMTVLDDTYIGGEPFSKILYSSECYTFETFYVSGTSCTGNLSHSFGEASECPYAGGPRGPTPGYSFTMFTLVGDCGSGGNPNPFPPNGPVHGENTTIPSSSNFGGCKFCPELEPAMDTSGYFENQLNNAIRENELQLIEIDCSQLENWQTLVQHTSPQSVIDKLEAIDENTFGDIDIQEIEDASGTVINLDYYPVTITNLPNNPSTGNQFTADEFLNHIRTNMNSFVDNSNTTFEPSTITGFDEATLWNSNNPLTSVIHLDINGGPGDGSVICSDYQNSNWIFTTLEVPYNIFVQGYDGEHPVSGNREFGYTLNADGSFTFYTRGVDRMTAWFDSTIAENFMDNPFSGAGALWNSFKEGIYNFTMDNGGSADPVLESDNSINRPDWEKVKEVLEGTKPISDLGC